MATTIIKTTFQIRRGLSSTWARTNPVLAYGEPGFERDTHKLKIGDGETAWLDLPYIGDSNSSSLGDNFQIDIDNGIIYVKGDNGELSIVADRTTSIDIDRIQKLFEVKE